MKDSKQDQENVKQLEKEAEAARVAVVDDARQYNPADDDPTWQTDNGDGC